MSRPLRIEYPDAYFHITARGNERRAVFEDQGDRERFLSYLKSATVRYNAIFHVFCLMDNHYHLLLQTPRSNLSQIMHYLNGAYTTYFNKKRHRSGHLFQGRYKAILVDMDTYAQELSRYIHLNPVRAGLVPGPEDYHWSSYRKYIGLDKGPDWLFVDFVLGCFSRRRTEAQRKYREFIESLLKHRQQYRNPLDETVFSTILGSPDFVNTIRERFNSGEEISYDVPASKVFQQAPSLEEIEEKVRKAFGDELSIVRQVGLYISHQYSGVRLKEIGKYYGVGASGVSQASRRIADRMKDDSGMARKIREISRLLRL